MANIWIIGIGEPIPYYSKEQRPWRNIYLGNYLVDRGHNVVHWASTMDHINKRFFVEGSVFVKGEKGSSGFSRTRTDLQFLHGCKYRRNMSILRVLNHYQLAKEFKRISKEFPRPDVILCSFPPPELSGEAVRFGLRYEVPTFVDVRDLWPEVLLAKFPRVASPFVRTLLFPMDFQVRRALRNATGIVGISQTHLDWACDYGSREAGECDLVIPLSYPQAPKLKEKLDSDPSIGKKLRALGVDPSRKIFWFCGSFNSSIDLSTVIEAARRLRHIGDIQFVFTGTGEFRAKWMNLASGLPNIVFTGWLDQIELCWIGNVAWVGLATYKRNAVIFLSNKIFEYMNFRLPILLSLEGETKELITQERIGVCYQAEDPEDLAAKVQELAQDEVRRDSFSKNCHELFRNRYSPEIIYTRFAEFLEEQTRKSK